MTHQRGRGGQRREGEVGLLWWSSAGGLGSILSQGARFHMLQLKIPCATTKTQCSQINKYFFKKREVGRPCQRRLQGQFPQEDTIWDGPQRVSLQQRVSNQTEWLYLGNCSTTWTVCLLQTSCHWRLWVGRSGCASDRPGDESFLSLLLVVVTMHKPTNLSKPWLSHLQKGHNSDHYTSGGFIVRI